MKPEGGERVVWEKLGPIWQLSIGLRGQVDVSTLIGEKITHGSALEGKIAGIHFRNLFLPAPSFIPKSYFFSLTRIIMNGSRIFHELFFMMKNGGTFIQSPRKSFEKS